MTHVLCICKIQKYSFDVPFSRQYNTINAPADGQVQVSFIFNSLHTAACAVCSEWSHLTIPSSSIPVYLISLSTSSQLLTAMELLRPIYPMLWELLLPRQCGIINTSQTRARGPLVIMTSEQQRKNKYKLTIIVYSEVRK